jgi:hypothetical protein
MLISYLGTSAYQPMVTLTMNQLSSLRRWGAPQSDTMID